MARLDQKVSSRPWSMAQFARYCPKPDNNAGSLVLSLGQKLTGYAVYQWILDEATLLQIAVDPGHRRKGYGKRLLNAVVNALQEQRVARCLLEVRESNVAALSLYIESGFRIDGKREAYYPDENGREDAILMSCSFVSEIE